MYKSNNAAVIVKGARFMPCTLVDEESGKEIKLNIKAPKLKTLRKFEQLSENPSIEDLTALAAAVLTNNKENVRITADIVEETMTIDEVYIFFEDFTNWISETRNADPN